LKLIGWALLAAALGAGRAAAKEAGTPPTFAAWLAFEEAKAIAGIEANVSPAGTPPGFVIASPSTRDPDYYFHWTRDSALTMAALVDLAEGASAADQKTYRDQLSAYVTFSRQTQRIDTLSGKVKDHHENIGEPKFNTDGSGYTGDWGRPQADGPALRVIAVSRFMKAALFPAALTADARAAVTADLDYIVHHGQGTTFDLWEETKGHHFYTEMVQRRALLMGAEAAHALGDRHGELTYRALARKLSRSLARHWDSRRGYLVETRGRDGGCDYKYSNLDAGVVLASLHAADDDGFFAPEDERILATAEHLKRAFHPLYPINQTTVGKDGEPLELAIGRYPEDRYDGAGNTGGNPWVLITLGMGELDFRVAQAILDAGEVTITHRSAPFYQTLPLDGIELHPEETLRSGTPKFDALIDALEKDGDAFLARVRYHAPADGELSEQIDRTLGTMRSARDLTWSYASYLTALRQRRLLEELRSSRR
jgi:glucoamylase